MKEAAEYLGYSVDRLRKLIQRSRKRAKGSPVEGPFIKFFQIGQGEIRFKREWLDEFVEAHTVDPEATPLVAKQKRTKPKAVDRDYSIFSER
jgi:hypothetical protein